MPPTALNNKMGIRMMRRGTTWGGGSQTGGSEGSPRMPVQFVKGPSSDTQTCHCRTGASPELERPALRRLFPPNFLSVRPRVHWRRSFGAAAIYQGDSRVENHTHVARFLPKTSLVNFRRPNWTPRHSLPPSCHYVLRRTSAAMQKGRKHEMGREHFP